MKYCSNCGHELIDGNKFCQNCGAPTGGNNSNEQAPIIEEKNIALAVILTIITCGIYGIYWLVTINDSINDISDEQGPEGGIVILLSIITCGIYMIFWSYKAGQKLYLAGQKYNKPIADNSILYLILSIVELSIVNCCIIQSDLNRFSKQ